MASRFDWSFYQFDGGEIENHFFRRIINILLLLLLLPLSSGCGGVQ